MDAKSLIGSFDAESDRRLAGVINVVFHEDDGAVDEYSTENSNELCDIGTETDEEWEKLLTVKRSKVTYSRITYPRLSKLRQYRNIVSVRYNGGPPAQVRLLQLCLTQKVHDVRARLRSYPPEKRNVLRKYVQQLLSFGLMKPAERTNWVSAPLAIPKKPPALYRLTVHYKPSNKAIFSNTWPIPQTNAVLQDLRDAETFAAISFKPG